MNEHLAGKVIRPATNADRERVKTLIFSVLAEYGLSPDPQSTDADLEDIEGYYIKVGGLFELIEDSQGHLLGTDGLYPVDAQTAELRKIYLAPHARGKGLGSAILKRTIAQARNLGFKAVTLETASVLKEAVLLYTRAGFQEMPSEHLAARCDQAFILHL